MKITIYQLPVTIYQLPITSYHSPITITSIMQNKPNLLNAQINLSSVLTTDYANASLLAAKETNPIYPYRRGIKLEARHRSLRVSFLESSNSRPISPLSRPPLAVTARPALFVVIAAHLLYFFSGGK